MNTKIYIHLRMNHWGSSWQNSHYEIELHSIQVESTQSHGGHHTACFLLAHFFLTLLSFVYAVHSSTGQQHFSLGHVSICPAARRLRPVGGGIQCWVQGLVEALIQGLCYGILQTFLVVFRCVIERLDQSCWWRTRFLAHWSREVLAFKERELSSATELFL